MNIGLEGAVVVDVAALLLSVALVVRSGRLSFAHPATLYYIFHLFSFTSRAFGIWNGAGMMLSEFVGPFEPATTDEITRALLFADIALISSTLGWLVAASHDRGSLGRVRPPPWRPISPSILFRVVWIAFPLGLVGLYVFASIPGIEQAQFDFGNWSRSSWISQTNTWVGLCLLALVYHKGFRAWLLLPMGAYLAIQGYQGVHRFRVVLPILALALIWLDTHARRWPSPRLSALLLAAALVFPVLKTVGREAQRGSSISDITALIGDTPSALAAGETGDQTFLDQLAFGVSAVDRTGKYFYGSTYLSLLTLPIPRALWPEKPGLADHLAELSSDSRPMNRMGMIITYVGEAYANFGYPGVVVLPFVLAFLLTKLYFGAYRRPHGSVERLGYILLATNLVQVYRDGLTSIVVFLVVGMMPLVVLLMLHVVLRKPIRVAFASARATTG